MIKSRDERTTCHRKQRKTITADINIVHADPVTRLYHATITIAGEHSVDIFRPQTDRLGYAECPRCYWRHGGVQEGGQ